MQHSKNFYDIYSTSSAHIIIHNCTSYWPSVLVGNNVFPHTVFVSPADHTDVLLVLEVVLPVLTWSTIRFKVQLKCQRILRYKAWIIKSQIQSSPFFWISGWCHGLPVQINLHVSLCTLGAIQCTPTQFVHLGSEQCTPHWISPM